MTDRWTQRRDCLYAHHRGPRRIATNPTPEEGTESLARGADLLAADARLTPACPWDAKFPAFLPRLARSMVWQNVELSEVNSVCAAQCPPLGAAGSIVSELWDQSDGRWVKSTNAER
jgi:hypothetical protein